MPQQVDADGVSRVEWESLVRGVAAAHSRRQGAFRRTMEEINGLPIDSPRIGMYAFVLLYAELERRFGRQPTLEDVRSLTDQLFPEYSRIVRYSRDVLMGSLCAVCGIDGPVERVYGQRGAVSETVILGLLVEDPADGLARLRPALAQFWRENANDLRRNGMYP